MAIVTGTTWTGAIASSLSYNANVREDLEDVIWLLDPMDTWALSNLDRVDATSTTRARFTSSALPRFKWW